MFDYVAGDWGYKNYPGSEKIQKRAIRYFMGVPKFSAIPLDTCVGTPVGSAGVSVW